MLRLLSLIKVSLKNSYAITEGKTKNSWLKKLMPLWLLLAFIPSLISFTFLIRELLFALLPIQQEGLVIGLMMSASAMMTFFFGIFLIPSVFYFSKDIQTLLSLPLKPFEILISKLLVAMVYEYVTVLFIFSPVLSAYIPIVQPSPLFYIYLIIIILFIPLVPLIIDGFIIMLIMLFLPFAKNKDFFNYISGFLGLAFAIGINVFVNGFMVNLSQADIIQMLQEGNNSLMNLYSMTMPTIPFATKALVNGGLLDISIFILINLVFVFAFIFGAQMMYFKGVIGVSETGANRKVLSDKDYAKSTAAAHPILTYTIKELKLMIRTPIYLMNNISTIIIMPVVMFAALIPNFSEEAGVESITQLITWTDSSMSTWVLAIGLAVGFLMSGMNLITPTAISREGSNVWFMKAIPMSYFDQAMAKINSGLIISFLGSLLIVIPAGIYMHSPIIMYIHALIGVVLSCIAMNFWGMLVDIYHPKLVWEQEASAVKQNINAVFTMLPGFALATGLVSLMIFTQDKLNDLLSYRLILMVFSAVAVLTVYLLQHFCESGMNKIQA